MLVLNIVFVVSFVINGVEDNFVSSVSTVDWVVAEVGAIEFDIKEAEDELTFEGEFEFDTAAATKLDFKFEPSVETDLIEFLEDNDFVGDFLLFDDISLVFECKLVTEEEDFKEDFDFVFFLSWWVNFFVLFFKSSLMNTMKGKKIK